MSKKIITIIALSLSSAAAYDVPIECGDSSVYIPAGVSREVRDAVIAITPRGPSTMDIVRDQTIRDLVRTQPTINLQVK